MRLSWARVEFDLTLQAGCGIVAISVSGYSVNTEYSGYKVSISTEVLFGAFFVAEKFRTVTLVSACRPG